MAKLTLSDLTDLQNRTSFTSSINTNNSAIEIAIENTLSRDGTSPNTMGATLDMNSNQITNLPNPATANSPLRLQDLNDFVGGGTVANIPIGGTTGQALVKTSNTNYATGWSSVLLSIANVDTTLTISTVSGAATASLNLNKANTWVGIQTLTTPILGTPTSGTLTNCTGLPVSTGVSGLATGIATFLATPTSANLIAAVTNETGTGSLVFATSPTFVTPLLGTPTSGTLTSCTGLPISTGVSGLGTGVATFLGTPSSANLLSALTDKTGTGVNVFGTTPTLATPVINGISTGTGVSATATANTLALRDASGNVLVNGFTATSASGTATIVKIIATATGGRDWWLESTDNGNGNGGGKLIVFDNTASAVRSSWDSTGNFVNNASIQAGTYIKSGSTVVGSLPSAAGAGPGSRFFVTDANASTFGTTAAGGGANIVPVYSDGTNWKIG